MPRANKENIDTSSNGNSRPTRSSVHYGLARQAEWAAGILEALMQQPSTEGSKANMLVPRMAIARAKGLAFFEQDKYGVMFSIAKSSGFLVRNLGWENGQPKWSAPLFMEMVTGGMGLSLGMQKTYSCIVLNTEEAVDDFAQGKPVIGFDAKVHMSSQPVQAGEEMQLGDEIDDENEVVVYSIASGRMLDVSLQGGSIAPSSSNQRLYGKGATTEQILTGEIGAPKEFKDIYNGLSHMTAVGCVMLNKLRHAGLQVYESSRAPASYRSS